MNAPQLLDILAEAERDPNPFRSQESIRAARQAIERSMRTSSGDRQTDSYPSVQQRTYDPIAGPPYLETQRAPNLIMVAPAVPAIAPGGAASAPITMRFQGGAGIIIGWRGSVWDTTPGALAAGELERVTCQVRLLLNTDTELVTNGIGADFVPYADVFANGQAFSPLLREVCSTDVLQIVWRNVQPAVGGSTLQPSLAFAFLRTSRRGA
ncbi:MAG: hypothetical protein A2V88_08275 [Elusimicrobia bacterium RBG_16_66_12]|nr:MAG: hypothetical protein A2V88_08275 [Elusimicrobia bacterium RBG_16_66_12]